MEKNGFIKIAVLGAESTGKTWLCENLAGYFDTTWVPEYARQYFDNSDIYNYSLADLITIAKKQVELEASMMNASKGLMISDTALITLKVWAELEFKQAPYFIEEEVRRNRYDHYFIMDNDIPWEKDEQRLNKFSRDLIKEMNIKEVETLGTPFTIISGKEKDRLQQAVDVINRLRA